MRVLRGVKDAYLDRSKSRLSLELRPVLAISCLLALLLASGAPACTSHSDRIVLRLGHALDRSHPVHRGMVYFADLVHDRSRGRVRIDIYPNEQLGSERELLELLQIGGVGIAKVGATVLETFQPSMSVLGLPYIFPDRETSWLVLDGRIGRRLLNESSRFGFRGLCFYDSGSRNFYTRTRDIRRPEDLRGLSIRIPRSVTSQEMVTALGGSVTAIAIGELYGALQQGVVDGAENNPVSYYFSRHFEVCPNYSLDEHARVPDVLLASGRVWQTLPADVQVLIEQAAIDSSHYQRRVWEQSERDCVAKLKAAGVRFTVPERALFRQAVVALYEEYRQRKETREVLLEIEAITKSSNH